VVSTHVVSSHVESNHVVSSHVESHTWSPIEAHMSLESHTWSPVTFEPLHFTMALGATRPWPQ
jgi:hypothetical protein